MYTIIGADGREYGPITAEELRLLIAEGRASAQTLTLAAGTAQWKPLKEFVEFASTLAMPTPGVICVAPIPTTNTMALIGLILGVLAIVTGACCCYGLPFNLLGIVFSLVGLSQIRQNPVTQQGQGLALWGLALCVLSMILAVLVFALGLALSTPDFIRELRRM